MQCIYINLYQVINAQEMDQMIYFKVSTRILCEFEDRKECLSAEERGVNEFHSVSQLLLPGKLGSGRT